MTITERETWTGVARVERTRDYPGETMPRAALRPVVRKNFVTCRRTAGSIRNAARQGAADSPPKLREIGQRWLDAGAAAVLKVPSAVVVEEWNYVLNPQHPDFKKLIFQKPKRFQFDRRLARERKS
jgi:RES domain-containing protein